MLVFFYLISIAPELLIFELWIYSYIKLQTINTKYKIQNIVTEGKQNG
jgi:hypothetical protein